MAGCAAEANDWGHEGCPLLEEDADNLLCGTPALDPLLAGQEQDESPSRADVPPPSPLPEPSDEPQGASGSSLPATPAGRPGPLCPASLPLPPQTGPSRPTLVLDLDGTLIASEELNAPTSTYTWNPNARAPDYEAIGRRVWLRPGVKEFLAAVRPHFEIVLFTAATQNWAAAAVDQLDPAGFLFDVMLHRDHTTSDLLWDYVKDLSRLGRDLARTVIVDDNPLMFMYQPDNALHIAAYEAASCGGADNVLDKVGEVLINQVVAAGDVRDVLGPMASAKTCISSTVCDATAAAATAAPAPADGCTFVAGDEAEEDDDASLSLTDNLWPADSDDSEAEQEEEEAAAAAEHDSDSGYGSDSEEYGQEAVDEEEAKDLHACGAQAAATVEALLEGEGSQEQEVQEGEQEAARMECWHAAALACDHGHTQGCQHGQHACAPAAHGLQEAGAVHVHAADVGPHGGQGMAAEAGLGLVEHAQPPLPLHQEQHDIGAAVLHGGALLHDVEDFDALMHDPMPDYDSDPYEGGYAAEDLGFEPMCPETAAACADARAGAEASAAGGAPAAADAVEPAEPAHLLGRASSGGCEQELQAQPGQLPCGMVLLTQLHPSVPRPCCAGGSGGPVVGVDAPDAVCAAQQQQQDGVCVGAKRPRLEEELEGGQQEDGGQAACRRRVDALPGTAAFQ